MHKIDERMRRCQREEEGATVRTMSFLLLLVVGAGVWVLFVFLGLGLWRLAKSWPIPLRLAGRSVAVALGASILTPSIFGGENFAFLAPVLFVLIDSISRGDWVELWNWAMVPMGVVAGVVWVLSGGWIFIRYLFRGREKLRRG